MSEPGGDGKRGGGDDDGGRRRGDWAKVRSGGRVAFHTVITLATIAFSVGGEVAGNLIFRKGHHLADQAFNAAIFGFLAGNLLAWWLWKKEDAKT